MSKWMDIETAPKDGTEIIVGRVGFTRVKLVFYSDCGWYDGYGGQWSSKTFTHWMPMPEPPQPDMV